MWGKPYTWKHSAGIDLAEVTAGVPYREWRKRMTPEDELRQELERTISRLADSLRVGQNQLLAWLFAELT